MSAPVTPLSPGIPRQAMHRPAGGDIASGGLQAALAARREYARAACTPTPLTSTMSASTVPVNANFCTFIAHLLRSAYGAASFEGKPLWFSNAVWLAAPVPVVTPEALPGTSAA